MPEPCKIFKTRPDEIKNAKTVLESVDFDSLLDFFKLMSGKTRLKILLALSKSSLCVCDIWEILNSQGEKITISAVSHQLKALWRGRLVTYRREGKEVYYSLERAHVEPILSQVIEHLEEEH